MTQKDNVHFPVDGYDKCFSVEDQSFWFKSRNKIINYFVSKYLTAGNKFQDIGGGNGFVSQMLQDDLGLDVTLIEPGAAGCENAQRRGIQKVYKGFFQDSFDNLNHVGLFDVVEHIPEPHKFLVDIQKRQRSGDLLFITVPAYNILWSHEDVIAEHQTRYTRSKITKLVNQSGYQILETASFFMPLILPILLLRAVPYRLKRESNQNLEKDLNPSWFLSLVMSWVLRVEMLLISIGIRIPFGASILVVARKQ